MVMVRWTLLAALCLAAILQGAAFADGCYIPEKAIAKLPEIPAQRALVAFKDGKETLIVESALEGQGRRFGWIIPVPAAPEIIEAASPGTLKSLAMGIQPRIVHDLGKTAFCVTFLCALVLLLVGICCWGKRTGHSVVSILLLFLVLLLVVFMLVPTLLTAHRGGPVAGGATVLERLRAGSYEVAVLAAADADALYKWLEAEELAIPEALRPAVEDYAKRGWRFVTARLVTDGAGKALPHPLRIVFKTERAVYPMKLTALSGRALDLELYVVGEKAAGVPGLKRVFCDRFPENRDGDDWFGDYSDPVYRALRSELGRYAPHLRGKHSRLNLGHPGLRPALWDGCWVSKLAGKVPASAMADDYYISWSEPAFKRQTFFSRQGAGLTGWMAGALLFSLTAAALMVLWAYSRVTTAEFLRLALAAAIVAGMLFGVLKLALPQVETSAYNARSGRVFAWHDLLDGFFSNQSADDAFRRILKRLPGRTKGETVQGLPPVEGFRQAFAWLAAERKIENVYTGEPVREEDSPGNYTVAEKDGKLTFTMYDLGGTPVSVEIKGAEEERR